MEDKLRLSVIVPVYNMAEDNRLGYCLDSLVSQTIPRSDYEVIAVDDASTDGSYDILLRYEQDYPGLVKAYRSEVNHRQGGAKNIGLAHAAGEWIGFIDSDDWVTEDYYERLLKKAEETGADIVGCDYCLVDEHTYTPGRIVRNNSKEQEGELDEDRYKSLILESGSLVVKIYRRHIIYGDLDDGGYHRIFPEDIFYEDNAVANTWMLRAKHFAYIPEPMYFYYQHDSSTVHTITLKRLEDRMEAGRRMIEEARDGAYLDKYHDEIEYSFTRLFYINTLFSAMPKASGVEGCYSFCKRLCDEMKKTFPGFQDNPYYREKVHPEEKKLIAMQVRSHLLFYVYYRLLWWYRDTIRRG